MQAVSSSKVGCGLLDTDFEAGFDWLEMGWTYKVLEKKGCDELIVNRIKNLYSDSVTICVINNVLGEPIENRRVSLRQGDIPSMYWFSVGLDPVLYRLERQLSGIKVFSLPPAGPAWQAQPVLQTRHLARQHPVPEQAGPDPKNPPLPGPAGLAQAVAGPDLQNPPL